MRVLIDECLPRSLKAALRGHSCQTVQEAGMGGVKNGPLLAYAEGRFDVFVTADQNLRYQQNLRGRGIAVIVLPSNRLRVVERLVPRLNRALEEIAPSAFLELRGE